jgi:hypothetical protein
VNEVPYEFAQAGGYFGPTFTSVFFFENVFWRVVVPVVFGTHVQVNMLESLVAMPVGLRQHLVQSVAAQECYKAHWVDCLDYDQGRGYFNAQPPSAPETQLVVAADRDLLSTIADLAQDAPNSNAMHNARLATEKALKAFLCFRHRFTVDEVRTKFGHDVKKLATQVVACDPESELAQLLPAVRSFAPHRDRYANRIYSRSELWTVYQCAQFANSSLMRVLTPHNQRSHMGLKQPFHVP